MVMIVSIAPDKLISPGFLESILNEGMKNSQCQCDGEPKAVEVPPSFFLDFKELIGQTEGKRQEPIGVPGKGLLLLQEVEISPEDSKYPHRFRITLSEPARYMSRIELKYDDGSPDDLTDDTGERLKRLGLDEQKREQYRILTSRVPKSYKMTVTPVGQGKDVVYEDEWPKVVRHYAVTFINFQGNFEALKRALLDKDVKPTSQPFEKIDDLADTRFLLSEIGVIPTDTPGLTADGKLIITQIPIRDPGVDRVFVKLPLTKEQLLKELPKWRQFETGAPVIMELGKEGVKMSEGNMDTLLTAEEAGWYELTPEAPQWKPGMGKRMFRKTFLLGDAANRKGLIEKHPDMYMLVIQQLGDGDDAVAVSITKNGQRIFVDDAMITDPDILREKEVVPVPSTDKVDKRPE